MVHAGTQVDQPVRPLNQCSQDKGGENIDREDPGNAGFRLDAPGLAIADSGVVDDGIAAAEPVDLLGDAFGAGNG